MTLRGRPQQSGFTVIEALIASTIFALVVLGTLSVYSTHSRLFNRGQSKAEVQQNSRTALETASRELRMAGYDRSGVIATLAQATSIQTANAGDIAFVADVTNDGVVDRVSYQLSGTKLMRSLSSWTGAAFGAATTGEIADGVTSLAFSYFDTSDAALAAPVAAGSLGNIRRVTIAVSTSQTTVGALATFPLVADVRIRN